MTRRLSLLVGLFVATIPLSNIAEAATTLTNTIKSYSVSASSAGFALTASSASATTSISQSSSSSSSVLVTVSDSSTSSDSSPITNSSSSSSSRSSISVHLRADYDLDDNGLIEINSWVDLDEIRNNTDGSTLYGDSIGCPGSGCIGFELTTDLDFDTNDDGKLDAKDSYWNDGLGWVAIGESSASAFKAIFEGNGHVIRNLYINRTDTSLIGLIGYSEHASFRNLGLQGKLMSIQGSMYVGGLVGFFDTGSIVNCFSTGAIKSASGYAGGLVGQLSSAVVKASFTTGSVETTKTFGGTGGIVGAAYYSTIQSSFSLASVISQGSSGGLVGGDMSSTNIETSYAAGKVQGFKAGGLMVSYIMYGSIKNSHWATDTTGQSTAINSEVLFASSSSEITGPAPSSSSMRASSSSRSSSSFVSPISTTKPATLAQLKCPTSADNTSCASGTTLYVGWGQLKDSKGNAYWDFGTDNELPTLVLNGIVYRDSDNDDYWDAQDAYPLNSAAATDTDGDGSPDRWNATCDINCQIKSGLKLDKLPKNAAASEDTDGDGRPDLWALNCNISCQKASGLTLDKLPNDKDNDGVPDSSDPDNTVDNGKPYIVAAPADMNIPATGNLTLVTLAKADVIAFDEVDSQLILEVSLAGEKLVLNNNNQVSLPSGALELQWVAIDKTGNRSLPATQYVNVYPQVQFTTQETISGEKNTAKLGVSFSGNPTIFPITLGFSYVKSDSTASTEDIDTSAATGIDLSKLTIKINNADELAKTTLYIPVVLDSLAETDESMVFEITSASAGKDAQFTLPIVTNKKRTTLTITDRNLAPSVSLHMAQAGETTTVINHEAGDVTVTALVSDLNGMDQHSFLWETTDLPVIGSNQATYTFDPYKLNGGNYSVKVKVTDNGLPPLSSDLVKLDFSVTPYSVSSSSRSSSSSSSSPNVNSSSSSVNASGSESEVKKSGGGGNVDIMALLFMIGFSLALRGGKVRKQKEQTPIL